MTTRKRTYAELVVQVPDESEREAAVLRSAQCERSILEKDLERRRREIRRCMDAVCAMRQECDRLEARLHELGSQLGSPPYVYEPTSPLYDPCGES